MTDTTTGTCQLCPLDLEEEGGNCLTMSLDVSQSTSSCSDSEMSLPVLMKLMPSMEPVVENAQHDPHCNPTPPSWLSVVTHQTTTGYQARLSDHCCCGAVANHGILFCILLCTSFKRSMQMDKENANGKKLKKCNSRRRAGPAA